MLAKLPAALEAISAAKMITPENVLAIRKLVYPDGAISDREAEWVLALNAAGGETCEDWNAFYVEALTDFTVFQMAPRGHVTEENARWLIARLMEDGQISSSAELELVVNIMEMAESVPSALSAFALNAVKEAVVAGGGEVTAPEVELLRRILYAFGSGSAAGISRDEAEVLFDINDASAGAANDPAWSDLFAKAIASHIMMASGYAAPSREEALRRERWLADTDVNVAGFFGRMVSSLGEIFKGSAEQGRVDAQDAAISEAEKVTGDEAEWIVSRMDRDGAISEAERAALTFIKREAPEVHPALKPLLDKVA